ncbi:MAG TPA: nuclear transport factor 2 family protein [Thermoanaerobaculia bacterium]
MVRLLGITSIAVLLCAATPEPPAVSNDTQIRQLADDFAATWNKHDPTNMAYFWSADGDLINPSGRKAKGLTEIQRLFQDEHKGPLKDSTFTVTGLSIRYLDSTLALMDEDAEISGVTNPDGSTVTLKPHVFNVLRKSGGKWWIVSTRAYSYLPPPPPPPPPPAPVPK